MCVCVCMCVYSCYVTAKYSWHPPLIISSCVLNTVIHLTETSATRVEFINPKKRLTCDVKHPGNVIGGYPGKSLHGIRVSHQ